MSADALAPSRVKRWLREPLLHFLRAGLVLFAAFRILHPDPDRLLGVFALAKRIKLAVSLERYARPAAPYAIGVLASFWFCERLAGF